jgi:hypothetical protein
MVSPTGVAAGDLWVSLRREYEGFPLYLRYPTSLDYDALQLKFSLRLVLTHTFSFRRFDGAPEPQYNDTLEELDLFLTRYFRASGRGQVVLVETFGGKRNYYFYLAEASDSEEFLAAVHERFPGQRVDGKCANDPEWKFIRRYRSEYLEGV